MGGCQQSSNQAGALTLSLRFAAILAACHGEISSGVFTESDGAPIVRSGGGAVLDQPEHGA